MKICSPSHHPKPVRNGRQLSRRDKYRSEVTISQQDREDHLAINWRPDQTPSSLIQREGSHYTVSNFRWGFNETGKPDDWAPDNQTTTIDASKVKEIYLALEPFAPEVVAGHGLMVFVMEGDGDVKGPDGRQDVGFAVSVEARKPVGMEYGLGRGMKKNFGMIYQLGSLSDQLQKVTRQRGHKLVLHRLDLNEENKQKLIHDALDESVEDRLGEWYHTLTNSCYTASVDLVNGVVPDDQKMARWTEHLRIARLNTFLPALGGATLRSKELLAKEPITYLQPSPVLWADKQEGVGPIQQAVGKASRSPLFTPAFRVAGAAGTGAIGYALGGIFGQTGAYVGAAIGAVSGIGLGRYLGDVVATKTDQKAVNALEWYAEKADISMEEAAKRVAHD